jgi:hypothetical protein
LRSKSVDGAQKGSAARNVTETKFIWKNRKLKRPYKRSFLIQMALLRDNALRHLVVFSTTYLCEEGFSNLLLIKNKQRNRLDATNDMRIALSSTISPRISQLVDKMQAQKSH